MSLRRPAKEQPENFEFNSASLVAAKITCLHLDACYPPCYNVMKKKEYKQILSRFSEPVFGDFG